MCIRDSFFPQLVLQNNTCTQNTNKSIKKKKKHLYQTTFLHINKLNLKKYKRKKKKMSVVKTIKDNNIIDEIYQVYEEMMKQQLYQSKIQAQKDFPELTQNFNPSQKTLYRKNIMEQYNNIMDKCIKPLQQIIASSISHLSTLKNNFIKHESLEKFPLTEKGDCLKLHNKMVKYSSQANFKMAKVTNSVVEKEFIKFDRYYDFITYPSKNVSTKQLIVNIQNQGIGDNGIENVANQLQKFSNIQSVSLNLSSNNISEKGAKFLSQALFCMKNLRNLNLNLYNNKLKDQGIKLIMPNIAQMTYLQELNLELACNNIGNKGIGIVSQQIINMRNLNKLWLGVYNNQIFEVGMNEFLHQFNKFPVYKVLKLDFRLNPVTVQNQQALKTIIKQKKIVESDIQF
eukprot:TRINITY_DN618_c0_g1_i5.p1 TRINITY_DN618_c0_g1~~TRINITY_DN618_c0_g1_i5.p1  ORF type:complete len:399 (-),score=69.90 TRINITY_DN618_c0_g1_i5:189-1385(-)